MRTLFLIAFLTVVFGQTNAQKKGLLFAEKINFEKQPEETVKKQDTELKEDMDKFLGFGLNFAVNRLQEEEKKSEGKKKKSEGISIQIGLKLPKYFKTKPPEKLLKVGWNLGLNF
jgi:hypothetical protein